MKRLIKEILKRTGFELKRVNKTDAAPNRLVEDYREEKPAPIAEFDDPGNPLWEHFQNHREGPGIWKWEHYFKVYHQHFQKFIGRKVTILEIGIYSGGSLAMWKSYFGENCRVIGVDVEETCKIYANEYTQVFIGDQENREFWRSIRSQVDTIDIVVDDGGHTPKQQIVTLEETLPYISPGGVYLCEDIHGHNNAFAKYVSRLSEHLHYHKRTPGALSKSEVTPFQQSIHSICSYPYCVVIEKNTYSPPSLAAPKHGSMWQPFLNNKAKAKGNADARN